MEQVRLAQRRLRSLRDLRVAQRRRRLLLVRVRRRSRASTPTLCTFQVGGTGGRVRRKPVLGADGGPGRHRLRRVPERTEHGTVGAGRVLRQPIPARQVDGRRRNLVEPVVHRRSRGWLEGLPDQRARPADVQRLPVAGQLGRQHRREPDRRHALPRVRGQPERHARLGKPGHEHRCLRDELVDRRSLVVGADSRRRRRGRPMVPMGRRQPNQRKHRDPLPRPRRGERALYTTALAEGTPGSLAKTTITTAPSDPTHSIYFQAHAPGCDQCATFHGDYINVSYGSDGHANATWTDMREFRPAERRASRSSSTSRGSKGRRGGGPRSRGPPLFTRRTRRRAASRAPSGSTTRAATRARSRARPHPRSSP